MEVGLLMVAGGIAAGVFGSLLGLGGGILIVPLLHIGFDVPLRESIGVSLVCVIATSGASAAVYLERGTADLRLGSLLELATAAGAVVGGTIAFLLDERLLAGLFAVLLVYVALSMVRSREPEVETVGDEPAWSCDAPRATSQGVVGGLAAGVVSALLGIGGGIILVPLMHLVMRVPLRVATATSNLLMGVTATASAVVYLLRGGIAPLVAGPTAFGVFVGAALGSRIAPRVDVRLLRLLFVAVLGALAVEMTIRAVGGR
jgi:hypothetical protein